MHPHAFVRPQLTPVTHTLASPTKPYTNTTHIIMQSHGQHNHTVATQLPIHPAPPPPPTPPPAHCAPRLTNDQIFARMGTYLDALLEVAQVGGMGWGMCGEWDVRRQGSCGGGRRAQQRRAILVGWGVHRMMEEVCVQALGNHTSMEPLKP